MNDNPDELMTRMVFGENALVILIALTDEKPCGRDGRFGKWRHLRGILRLGTESTDFCDTLGFRLRPLGVSNSLFGPKSFSNFLHTPQICNKNKVFVPQIGSSYCFPWAPRGPGNLLLELPGRSRCPGSSRRGSGRYRRSSEEGRGED